jgi:hypothetical protein
MLRGVRSQLKNRHFRPERVVFPQGNTRKRPDGNGMVGLFLLESPLAGGWQASGQPASGVEEQEGLADLGHVVDAEELDAAPGQGKADGDGAGRAVGAGVA